MPVVLHLALDTIVWPALPVAIGALASRAVRADAARAAISALALAIGIALAHVLDAGVPRLPPIDTIGWIPIAAIAALLIAIAERRGGAIARAAIAFVVMTLAAWKIGRPVWPTIADLAPYPLAIGAATAVIAAALDRSASRVPPAVVLIALAIAIAGGSIACLRGHSALLAQLLGATAAVTGAAGLAAIVVAPSRACTSIAVIAAVAVLVYARLFATLPLPAVALLACAALAPLIGRAALAMALSAAFAIAAIMLS